MEMKLKIDENDFCRMFCLNRRDLPGQFCDYIKKLNTEYAKPCLKDLEEYVLFVLKLINSPWIFRNKEENLAAWEKGWGENLKTLMSEGITKENLKPKYFRSGKFFRYNKGIVLPHNPHMEYDLFTLARYIIFHKYLHSVEHIYEFGCGTCQNLFILSEMYPSKELYGLDWAGPSVEIADLLNKKLNKNLKGILFNMLNPPDMEIQPGSGIITIHALEQIGKNHEKLLKFIINAKPSIVVHYEPILEFYDENNLVDYLALTYSEKRSYLSGFWTAIKKLEEEKKVKILEAYRPYLGGIIHEASMIVWRPL